MTFFLICDKIKYLGYLRPMNGTKAQIFLKKVLDKLAILEYNEVIKNGEWLPVLSLKEANSW